VSGVEADAEAGSARIDEVMSVKRMIQSSGSRLLTHDQRAPKLIPADSVPSG
jgi:hypothetical protein